MDDLYFYLKQTQWHLKLSLFWLLCEKKMNPIYKPGFVYAKGDIPVLLVAHMDTVGECPPSRIIYDTKYDAIYNPDGILGGDDRCGVYAIMKLLEKHRPHVLFTEDEEIGGNGAYKAVIGIPKPDVKYIIEIDRRGSKDCVFYECGNEDFMKYVENYGFKKNYGSFTDISILGKTWDIAAVNLSSGYYHEHTQDEYIIFNELLETINRVDNMLKDIEKAPKFDYKEITYGEDIKRYFLKRNYNTFNEDEGDDK